MARSRTRDLFFLGVSTGRSTIQSLFAPWADCLGHDMRLVTHDLPLRSSARDYRAFVESIRNRGGREVCGALVTSHKAAVYDSARDLFDRVSMPSERLGEIGMIYWDGDSLVGDANDAISTVEASRSFLVPSPAWSAGSRDALILGGGGAGLALASTLAGDLDIDCSRVVITEKDDSRAASIRGLIERWGVGVPIDVVNVHGHCDEIVAGMGDGCLIANATGLGKDAPGSPVTESVIFPQQAHLWEFNYRFVDQPMLNFMEVGMRKQSERELTIRDGWEYFVWGWLVVMATAVHLPPHTFYQGFRDIADANRIVH